MATNGTLMQYFYWDYPADGTLWSELIRNAADHGLEAPDQRRAAGKPEAGRITLSARHEGGAIVIEVAARNLRLRKQGYNAAKTLDERLVEMAGKGDAE